MHFESIGRAGRLALALLLLNAVVLAAGLGLQYWQDQPRLPTSYNADKVRLVGLPTREGEEAQGGTTGEPVPEAESPPLSEPASPAEPLPAPEAPPAAQATPQTGAACLRASLSGPADYAALRLAMQQAGLGDRALRMQERLGWWVYWPPINDPVQQVQALAAIDQAGIKDVAPVRQGPMARAISLGMFASEADARAHHAALARKGLTQLKYGPRPGTRTVYMEIAPADQARIEEMRGRLQGKLGLEEGECASGDR